MYEMPVADAMHPGIIMVDPGATAPAIAAAMAQHRVHCVVVDGLKADRRGEHRVWGIVTDMDLLAALRADSDADAAQLCASEPLTVAAQCRLSEAVALMVDHEVSHVVVVDEGDGHPTGILSTLDVARMAASPAVEA